MKKPQVTTTLGTAGIFNQFLIIFNDIKAVKFWDHITDMTCGEIYLMIVPIALYLWAILHDEDKDIKVL
jgi:hypothetical protein